jgi:hypothetical protein
VALTRFPDADPARKFAAEQCTLAVFESAGPSPRHLLDLDRAAASKRRIFRGQSFWGRLLEIAREENAAYQTYSYGRRADLYRLDLSDETKARIADAANRLGSGTLRSALHVLPGTAYVLLVCPRTSSADPKQTIKNKK